VWAACDAPRPLPPILTTIVRDFHAHNPPDFELDVSEARMSAGKTSRDPDLCIVESELGADGTPVYASHPTTLTTTGVADFNQWYHDVPGVHLKTMIDL